MGKSSRRRKVRRPRVFWHGGAPGREVADHLLAPTENFLAFLTYQGAAADNPYQYVDSPDRVFVTTSRVMATAFALQLAVDGAAERTGWLYRVEPIGPLGEDQDFAGQNVSFHCPRSRVLAVEAREFPGMTYRGANRMIGPFLRWTNGGRVYDDHGRMLPDPAMRHFGYTAGNLTDRFGLWADVADVSEVITAETRRRYAL